MANYKQLSYNNNKKWPQQKCSAPRVTTWSAIQSLSNRYRAIQNEIADSSASVQIAIGWPFFDSKKFSIPHQKKGYPIAIQSLSNRYKYLMAISTISS